MCKTTNVAVIIGSLRKASINRIFAEYIQAQFADDVAVQEINIADLPLYNQDYDGQHIDSYERVRQQIKQADGVLIVSPEHNRTMPAAVKNIIDIASRPYGQSVWANKKVAVVTAAPGNYGGINSGLAIRQSLQSLAADVMLKPEVYLSRATQSLSEDNQKNQTDSRQVSSERTQEFLQTFAKVFMDFVRS